MVFGGLFWDLIMLPWAWVVYVDLRIMSVARVAISEINGLAHAYYSPAREFENYSFRTQFAFALACLCLWVMCSNLSYYLC